MILALDLSTWTGVAKGAPGARPDLSTWKLPKGDGAVVGPLMDAFEQRLVKALDGVTLLAFEAPFIGSKMKTNAFVARRLYGLPAICEMHAHRRGIDVAEVYPSTLKSKFAGNGKASKDDMIVASERRGFTPGNDHEADASAVWWFVMQNRWPEHAPMFDPIFRRPA